MKILFLLPFSPRMDAAHGAGRVTSQFLAEMTIRHRVAILCLQGTDEPGVDDLFRARCERVEEVPRKSPGRSFGARLLRYLQLIVSFARLRPVWVVDWSSSLFAERVRSVVRDFQPDLIQADFHVMGQYFSALDDRRIPRLLVEHEPGTRAAPYLRNLPSVLSSWVHRIEHLSWRRYEAGLYRQVDSIVVFTEADRDAIRKLAGQTPVSVIPPGNCIPEHPSDPLGSQPPSLLFIGNFIHPPNMDAARRLVRVIFPMVQERVPEIRLFIVGDRPPAELTQLLPENITFTGWVPDLAPYLDAAALFVAPMYLGGGIRIKVLDALAAGKAVVTTPLAVEGLDLVDGKHVSLASSDAGLADCIIRLLDDPLKRGVLARQARAWAVAHPGWSQSVEKYEALYGGLVDRPGQRRSASKELVNPVG